MGHKNQNLIGFDLFPFLHYPDLLMSPTFFLIVPLSVDTQGELSIDIQVIDMRYTIVMNRIKVGGTSLENMQRAGWK